MKWFSKKQSEAIPYSVIPQEQKHEHKFQDFPWYIEYDIKTGDYQSKNILTYKIIEPYVCIDCGTRKDIVLEQREITGCSYSAMKALINKVNENYFDRIKPRAIVEDMINDLKMVDVNHLKWYHFLAGTEDPSTSRKNNIPTNKIDLKL